MNVTKFDKYISAYLDGDLRTSEIQEFEELLKNNPHCKEKMETYKTMLYELSSLGSLKTSENFLQKLHQKINNLPCFFVGTRKG